ncbi:hypothetical protein L596_024225 [Steinernema carpocapsae]|uniref:Tetraspanin n=1 Tax=Steinernema carpocapsae TaxID=34508 RepID=A0A4U5MG46_STECR|nr:hypothetical protein L596_024225 [Steinernema carpocapsae]
MVYGCGNQVIKFLVFSTNFLIFAFGALTLGFSLWANLDNGFTKHLYELVNQLGLDKDRFDDFAKYEASLWVLAAVGFLFLVVGFLGCCGAACESIVLLTLFFVIVLILSVIELGAVIFAIVNRTTLKDTLKYIMDKAGENETARKNLKPIMDIIHCCGATPSTRWIFEKEQFCLGPLAKADDCFTVVWDNMEKAGELVIIITIVALVIEFFSMVFSCILMKAFRERSPAYYA